MDNKKQYTLTDYISLEISTKNIFLVVENKGELIFYYNDDKNRILTVIFEDEQDARDVYNKYYRKIDYEPIHISNAISYDVESDT
jgi:hypothetical protein